MVPAGSSSRAYGCESSLLWIPRLNFPIGLPRGRFPLRASLGVFLPEVLVEKQFAHAPQMLPHRSLASVGIMGGQGLENGLVTRSANRYPAWTEHTRIPVQTEQAQYVSAEQVDETAIATGQCKLIMEVKISPFFIKVGKVIGCQFFMAEKKGF